MTSRLFSTTLALCAFLAWFSTPAAVATTFTVTSLTDDWAAGELRAAIVSSNSKSGSTIAFQNGLEGTIELSQSLPTITTATIIRGLGSAVIIIDAAGLYRPLKINAPSDAVSISGLTIQRGSDQLDSNGGAGIFIQSGIVSLKDITILECSSAGNGGGVTNEDTLTLTNCTLVGNSTSGSASNGGGIRKQ